MLISAVHEAWLHLPVAMHTESSELTGIAKFCLADVTEIVELNIKAEKSCLLLDVVILQHTMMASGDTILKIAAMKSHIVDGYSMGATLKVN